MMDTPSPCPTCGKPVKHFGFTKSGDYKHVLMLGYHTELKTAVFKTVKEEA